MEAYQERVVEELAQTEDRLSKLEDFRRSVHFNAIDREDQVLLNRQAQVMQGLVEILTERIARFKL